MIQKASDAYVSRTAQLPFSQLNFAGTQGKRTYTFGVLPPPPPPSPPPPPPPTPPPGPPVCTPGLECLNDACSACGPPCCVGGFAQCACQTQLNSNCSRTCYNVCC